MDVEASSYPLESRINRENKCFYTIHSMPEEAGVRSEWPGGRGQDGAGG